ncbi:MAG: YlxR family protein [Defluviitaleaceae bacterium]|nr:YlxR family protein [Defluviitaleaceae bacterium]
MITKKFPTRKCTGCKEMKCKKKLIRIVKKDGEFKIDFTSKLDGRGAYICDDINCLKLSLKTRGFERSFKCKIPKDIYESLELKILS